MKYQSIFTLILLTLFTFSTQGLYSNVQSLNDPFKNVHTLGISDDNKIILLGSYENDAYTYALKNQKYTLKQRLNESNDDIDAVDLTGDGKRLLVTDFSGKARIYFMQTNSVYSLNQTIDLTDEQNANSWAGAITNDHMYIFAGIKNIVKVFEYDGTKYVFLYNITASESEVRDIAITNDYQFLAIGTTNSEVFIYRLKNGTEYEKIQEILEESENQRRVFLTEDHEYLTVSAGQDDYVEIYKFNEDEQLFKKIKRFTYPEPVEYISISRSKKIFVVSTTKKT